MDSRNFIWKLLLSYICAYILMRPFLISYVSEYCKYLFLLMVLIIVFTSILSRRYINAIESGELFLLIASYLFIIFNALEAGGRELVFKAISAYILYTFPIIVFPFISRKVQWSRVFIYLSFFGVIDAGISIIEFVSRHRLFPRAGIEGDINLVTSAGAIIVRTYGLQGFFLYFRIFYVYVLFLHGIYIDSIKKIYIYYFGL